MKLNTTRPLRTFDVDGETRTLRPLVNETVPWGEVWAKHDFDDQRTKLMLWPFVLGMLTFIFFWRDIWVLSLAIVWPEILRLLAWLFVKVRFTIAGPDGSEREVRIRQVFRPSLPPSLSGSELHRYHITDANRRILAEFTPFAGDERTKGGLHGRIALSPDIPPEDAEATVRALLFAHNRPWLL